MMLTTWCLQPVSVQQQAGTPAGPHLELPVTELIRHSIMATCRHTFALSLRLQSVQQPRQCAPCCTLGTFGSQYRCSWGVLALSNGPYARLSSRLHHASKAPSTRWQVQTYGEGSYANDGACAAAEAGHPYVVNELADHVASCGTSGEVVWVLYADRDQASQHLWPT